MFPGSSRLQLLLFLTSCFHGFGTVRPHGFIIVQVSRSANHIALQSVTGIALSRVHTVGAEGAP